MTTLPQGRTVEQWVQEINAEWNQIRDKAVSGFIELGRGLIESKKGFRHGEWQTAIGDKLEFSLHTAQTFMRIAKWVDKNKTIDTINVLEALPPDYGTIDQLTRLDEPTLQRFVKNGTISPSLRRNEIKTIMNMEKVEADRKRVATLRPRVGKYKTLIADPAWEYEVYSEQARASCGYARQSMEELYALNMLQWAEPDCHLWCWTTNAYVFKAIELVRHWGFEFQDILTWVKPSIGRGKYLRNATEHVLFCTLGDLPAKTNELPSYFESPRVKHSEKPDEFYDIVRAMCWEPYGEANQRKFRPGFDGLFVEGELLQAAV